MENSHQDRGFAWVILFASSMSCIVSSSIYTVGIYNLIFLDVFGQSKALTAWCPAIMSSLLCLAGPLGGLITKHFGCRVAAMVGGLVCCIGMVLASLATNFAFLFVSFGFITGTGLGIAYTPSIVILGYYFKRYLHIAVGIAGSTVGIAIMFFPPLLQYLYDTFSWRGAVLLHGGILLHHCVLGALMRPPPKPSINKPSATNKEKVYEKGEERPINGFKVRLEEEKETIPSAEDAPVLNGYGHEDEGDVFISHLDVDTQYQNGKTKIPLYRNFKFLMFCASYVAMSGGIASVYMHFQAFAVNSYIERHTTGILMSTIGIGGTLGRAIAGFVVSYFKLPGLMMYMIYTILTGLATIALPLYGKGLAGFIIFAIIFGFFGNAYQTLTSPVLIDIVGMNNFAMAYGVFLMVGGIAYLLCPVLAGWMYDTSLSYYNSFYLAGFCFFLATVTAAFCVRWECCHHRTCAERKHEKQTYKKGKEEKPRVL